MPSLPFDESHTFTPPPAFGPYRVLHQVGSGVLGPVFRTYDPQGDRLVAVKAFRLDLVPEDVARLAEALRRLSGRTGQIAAGLEGTTAYLAIEYYAAETLDVALRHLAPAPLEAAIPLMSAMAALVDAAWAAGPSHGHGALHPRDIFVTPGSSTVGISGFGVAPALESVGARPPIRRPYTAPERTSGGAWDVRADVFSLGAIAHELLTGRRPAGPGQQDGTLPATMAPEVRVQIRRVLAKALAESPEERFASASDFVEALAHPSSLPESEGAPAQSEAPVARAADAMIVTPVTGAVADADVDIPATPSDPIVAAPVEAAEPLPRRRARIAAPSRPFAKPTPVDLIAPAPPAAVPVIDLPTRTADELGFAANTLDRPLPVRHVALPAPFPWAPFVAGCVASFILGGVAMRDWMQRSPSPAVAITATVPAAASAPERAAAPNAPAATDTAATDTEVRIPETEPTPRDTSKSGATPAPVSGRLTVKSAPAGASVMIDGKAAGQTPLTVNDLALSSHSVAVSKPGFVTETRRVVLSAKTPSSALQVSLDAERPAAASKAASSGSITVDSRPKGARVTIDGRNIGVTPLSAPGMKPGTHTVRVELAGHKPVVTTVVVKAGETAKLAVTLEQR